MKNYNLTVTFSILPFSQQLLNSVQIVRQLISPCFKLEAYS